MFVSSSKYEELQKELETKKRELTKLENENFRLNQALAYTRGFDLSIDNIEHGSQLLVVEKFRDTLVILKKIDADLYGVFRQFDDGTTDSTFELCTYNWKTKQDLLNHLNEFYIKLKEK